MTDFYFVANTAWLDFVNTEVMSSNGRRDLLASYADLLDWVRVAGLLPEADVEAARERWIESPEAERALEAARGLRARLRAAAERLAGGETVADETLAAVNGLLARPTHATLVARAGDRYGREERWALAAADDVLVPVSESARDLLCDGDLSLVRKCRNPDCILYFYDTTKNHLRAWCSMSACGNRTKVAAHYRRRRARADS
jgi:predicted RNA-binding Zn ribbon-like protein